MNEEDISDRNVLQFPIPSLADTPLVVDATVMKLVELGLLRFSPGIVPGESPGTFLPAIQVFANPSLLEGHDMARKRED